MHYCGILDSVTLLLGNEGSGILAAGNTCKPLTDACISGSSMKYVYMCVFAERNAVLCIINCDSEVISICVYMYTVVVRRWYMEKTT